MLNTIAASTCSTCVRRSWTTPRPSAQVIDTCQRIGRACHRLSFARVRLSRTHSPRPCSWTVRASSDVPTTDVVTALPQTSLQMIQQARGAVKRCLETGGTRQKLQLLLPVNEKQFDFLAIDPVDYPCSLQFEFDTCCSLVKAILEEVTGKTEFLEKRLDDGGVEGEPCVAIYPDSKDIVAVVFPTSDRLKNLKALAKEEGRPLLMVNPQWNDAGQVISDFGFGPWKKAAEDFLGSFTTSYSLIEQRVGSPGSVDPVTGERYVTGGVVRTLVSHPSDHQVFVMAPNGANQQVANFDHQPSYQELEGMLVEGRKKNLQIFDIAKKASAIRQPAGSDEQADVETQEGGEGGSDLDVGSMPSESEIDAMDAITLRQFLSAAGLPTSGRIASLKKRLKEAVEKASQ